MLKQIQDKLIEIHILEENETILSLIQVIDLSKKQHQNKKAIKEELVSLLPQNKYLLLATSKIIKILSD
jgi:hypothetical protein